MYLNWNDKTKTKEANLDLSCFFSFWLLLGAKWTFLSYQVIAVLYLHIKIKKSDSLWWQVDSGNNQEKSLKKGFRSKE